jgi:hypothetical protein
MLGFGLATTSGFLPKLTLTLMSVQTPRLSIFDIFSFGNNASVARFLLGLVFVFLHSPGTSSMICFCPIRLFHP